MSSISSFFFFKEITPTIKRSPLKEKRKRSWLDDKLANPPSEDATWISIWYAGVWRETFQWPHKLIAIKSWDHQLFGGLSWCWWSDHPIWLVCLNRNPPRRSSPHPPPPPKMIKSTGWTRVDNLSCPLISPSSFNDNDVRAAPLLWKLFLLLSVRYFQFFLLNHYPSSSSPSAFPLNFFFFFLFVSLLTRVTAFTQVN